MRIKEIPGLIEQVTSMLPVTQAEMWKVLGISSKEGSELIKYMLDGKYVKRSRTKIDGKWTFLLECVNGNRHAKKIDYTILLSGDKFPPCCGCKKDCMPANCMHLTDWVVAMSGNLPMDISKIGVSIAPSFEL